MLNVLSIVSYQFLPPIMGGQKGIALFNRFLSESVKLTCITTQNNDPALESKYEVLNILSNATSRYFNIFYFFKVNKIIREKKITHVIIEHPYYGWLGLLLKWFGKVKLVVHSHNIESERFRSLKKWWWPVLKQYEKQTHRSADHSFFIQDDDRNYAINNFGLKPELCTTITYGFEHSAAPEAAQRQHAKKEVCAKLNINIDDHLLLFNGTLNYAPNLAAVDTIVKEINPRLLKFAGFNYQVIICGNKLPAEYDWLNHQRDKHVIYAGFVEDINLYFMGTDLFINPVLEGGGIKTKLVEALGHNLAVVSTFTGGIGIPGEITNGMLKTIPDQDWDEFAAQVRLSVNGGKIPAAFFDHFYWGKIANRAAEVLKKA